MNLFINSINTSNEIKLLTIKTKSITLVYSDFPIPSDYKFDIIKIRISNLTNNTYINGLKTNDIFIIPVQCALGYRNITTHNALYNTLTMPRNNTLSSLVIGLYDMNDNLMVLDSKFTIHLYIQ